MNIVLVTPLYPPDTAASGRYVKELAGRLAEAHTVTIVAYGKLPEQVAGVRIISVSKQQPLLFRLVAFTLALFRATRGADAVYVENGASVELPAGFVARLGSVPFFMHLSDEAAHQHASKSRVFGAVERSLMSRVRSTIRKTPPPHPEILPFEANPPEAEAIYETAWTQHLTELNSLFSHA